MDRPPTRSPRNFHHLKARAIARRYRGRCVDMLDDEAMALALVFQYNLDAGVPSTWDRKRLATALMTGSWRNASEEVERWRNG